MTTPSPMVNPNINNRDRWGRWQSGVVVPTSEAPVDVLADGVRCSPDQYLISECYEERNAFGGRIVMPEHFEDIHYPVAIPEPGRSMPGAKMCSCGWTPFQVGDRWLEVWEHIAEQGDFGSFDEPGVRTLTLHESGASPFRSGRG